ncbi:MAG: ROK family protein [Planctomycetaceae bacterium]
MSTADPNNKTPSAPGPYFLGIDLGGTNIKAGVVANCGTPVSQCSTPTLAAEGSGTGVPRMCNIGEQAIVDAGLSRDDITAVGVATPGTMDIPAGLLLDPPNLPGWDNVPIRKQIGDHFSKPATLQNDANAAAYGEYWAGAAKDANSLAFWTLGTGVGGGIIIGDTIVEGQNSHGSECGHLILEMDGGRLCEGTGQWGTLEAYASATALVKRCNEGLEAGCRTSIRKRLESGEELTPILIGEEATCGDEFADQLIMETARFLGVGTTTVMHVVNPAMVLIGGAMTFGRHDTELGRRFLDRVREEVQSRAFTVPAKNTVIDYATLGGDAGFIGAAGCARLDFKRSNRPS